MHIPLTRIQKLISRRMLHSKHNKPSFYMEVEADVTELMAFRPKLRKCLGVKVTTNTFYIHALALGVEKYPLLAGRLNGDRIEIPDHVNIGFAVNAPQGLVVPVIRDAGRKTLPQIAAEEQILTDKARDNLLTLADIEGETVALSNLGIYGIDSFFGIIPPPASVILAVGNVIRKLLPIEGKPAIRRTVSLSLAVDGKEINEPIAAKFLLFIKEHLQNPQQLLEQ
ncbi:MAG: 2-oxo acid dehydrogenase subunit E2 [Sedimentisphaerales bacterium]|nr:2-oxo acid dehydrogenase subunit E2 [Sedimentisphaerales bacterium]